MMRRHQDGWSKIVVFVMLVGQLMIIIPLWLSQDAADSWNNIGRVKKWQSDWFIYFCTTCVNLVLMWCKFIFIMYKKTRWMQVWQGRDWGTSRVMHLYNIYIKLHMTCYKWVAETSSILQLLYTWDFALSSWRKFAGNITFHVGRKSQVNLVCHAPIPLIIWRRKRQIWPSVISSCSQCSASHTQAI